MDENRDRKYLHLIQELLRCPPGQERTILAENTELLDAGLAETIRQIESDLAAQAEQAKVEFLLNLAQTIRNQAYIQLINALLSCPSGEEVQQVLNANRELVDAGLVQMMIQAAEGLEEKGDPNAAVFLIDLARKLAESLGRSGNVAADNPSPTATPEEYFNFLRQVLQVTLESKGDPEIVYPFLRQNLDKLNLNFSSTIQQWWQNTLPNNPSC